MSYFRAFAIGFVISCSATAAQANLEICNETRDTQSVSVGYKNGDDWTSEGWWNIEPGNCATVVGGDLQQRYYYLRAEVAGGPFEAEYTFCTTPEEYTIVGDTDCEARGYDVEGFLEIDTGATASEFSFSMTQAEMDIAQAGGSPTEPDGGTVAGGLRFCNSTEVTQSVSVGYQGEDGWVSEGWWNVEPSDCMSPIATPLESQYYYYRAEVQGGEFAPGSYSFCTHSDAFTIVGDTDCEDRGYETENFAEIQVSEGTTEFTFDLTMETGGDHVVGGDTSSDTSAGLTFCNQTDVTQSVSIGYQGGDGWTSEGWWNVEPGNCSTPISEPLDHQYYYYRAEVEGGEFTPGSYSFCTDSAAYTIVGDTDCEGRGYETEDFAEISVGESVFYSVNLTADTGGALPESTSTPNEGDGGFHVCNETNDVQSFSIGYRGVDDWTSEGWWNVQPNACQTLLNQPLEHSFYYLRTEVESEPYFGEGYTFCTTSEAYTIVGDANCEARGYDTEEFTQVELNEGTTDYTYTLLPIAGDDSSTDGTGVDDMTESGAGLEFCNETSHAQAISVGYNGAEGWTSEGWWNIEPGDCLTPNFDSANQQYFYYRAEVDGGEFVGQNYFFCTSPGAYTIVGDADCEARGYDREDFREIDTGGESGMFQFVLVDGDGGQAPGGVDDSSNGIDFGRGDDEPTFDPDDGPTFGDDDGHSSGNIRRGTSRLD